MTKGTSIAIRQVFTEAQPRVFGVETAKSSFLSFGKQAASVNDGFSCNVHEIRLVPHCNGTHSEGVGHISQDPIALPKSFSESFLRAHLISVTPRSASTSSGTYAVPFGETDLVIDLEIMESTPLTDSDALIIRTLPNLPEKTHCNYDENPAAFFTIEAMEYIRTCGFDHLLVDVPSIDRLEDNGHLACHRIFFGLPMGSVSPSPASLRRSVTEMIYVPNDVMDGEYTLQIQSPPFELEAVPSNPMLYPISLLEALSK